MRPLRHAVPLSLLLCAFLATAIGAQPLERVSTDTGETSQQEPPPRYPVLLGDDTLFLLQAGTGHFSARERAAVVTQRVMDLLADTYIRGFVSESLQVVKAEGGHDLVYGARHLIRATAADAAPGARTDSVAAAWHENVRRTFDGTKADAELWDLIMRAGGVIGILILIVVVELLVFRLARRIRVMLARYTSSGRLPVLRIQSVTLLTPQRSHDILVWLFKILVTVAHVVVAYAALLLLFSVFPWTREWASVLLSWTWRPIRAAVNGFIEFIPSLFHILVVLLFAHLFLRLLKRLTIEIESGNLVLPGFYPDWGRPTLNIVRFVTYAFALVLIFPHLPGSDSVAFKGVSVFLGILVSLGSSAAFSNIVAGIVITYMRSFSVGDRVQVGTVIGDVTEKTLLVTRIKTFHGETVTLPNSALLAGNTINYTVAAQGQGLLLHANVTMGYDVPWRKVHALLIEAARRTPGVAATPEPFVLQKALNDFYVEYEINLYTPDPSRMLFMYSDLHQNIQDCFTEAGLDLLSPHYRVVRADDGGDAFGEARRRTPEAPAAAGATAGGGRE